MPWCGKFNKRTGTCPHGCTWRNYACHRYSRNRPCRKTPCPFVHVEPQCDADGPFVSSSAGARHRSRSPQPARAPAPPERRAPSPRTCEALLLIGIDSNEAGITKGLVQTTDERCESGTQTSLKPYFAARRNSSPMPKSI